MSNKRVSEMTDDEVRALVGALPAPSEGTVMQVVDLVFRWRHDATAFPDGAASVLEEIAELLLGGDR